MIVGFVIWSVVSLGLACIGLFSWKSKKPIGFFAGVKPPEVKSVEKYNHAVGRIWYIYAIAFELFGLPLLFLKHNSAGFIVSILGVVLSSIGLAISYSFILAKYQKDTKI